MMKTDSITYKVFDYIREKRAVTREEIGQALNLPNTYLSRYIDMLLEQRVIKQGKPVQSKRRKWLFVNLLHCSMKTVKVNDKDYLEEII